MVLVTFNQKIVFVDTGIFRYFVEFKMNSPVILKRENLQHLISQCDV